MVKQQYREIVAVQTGGIKGESPGFYYYDSRPNTPKTLLFQPTTAAQAYQQSRTKGTPTTGAFFGTGTGAPGYYTTTKSGEKKLNPGGEGRYQLLNYTRNKVSAQQIADAKFKQMSLEDQKEAIMQGLTPEQRAGVQTGTKSLTHRPASYAPFQNLYNEYGIAGYGERALRPESWMLSQTPKGVAQQIREGQTMWELGEGLGIPTVGQGLSSFWDSYTPLDEIKMEMEFNPQSIFSQTYGDLFQPDRTDFIGEFGTGYTVPMRNLSAILQYEADQIPRYDPPVPYSLSQNLQNIANALFGAGPWLPNIPTNRPESLQVDPVTGVGLVTWPDSPTPLAPYDDTSNLLNLTPTEAAKVMLIPGYGERYGLGTDWRGVEAGFGEMGTAIQQAIAPLNPFQALADQLYPRTGTTWDEWVKSGLGYPYESPEQGGDSIFGAMGFFQALANKYGYQTPHDTYDPTVFLTGGHPESLQVDLWGMPSIEFGPSSSETTIANQLMGHYIDRVMRNERMLLEGPKAGLNLLNIPLGLEFLVGAGLVPGEIWRGGRSKEDYDKFMAERRELQRAKSFNVDPVTGISTVEFNEIPDIGRYATAAGMGAGIAAWAAGIPGALRSSYKKDPDLFTAQLLGELAAYPLIAGRLAKGGALSKKVGSAYQFVTEPGEQAFEALMNWRFPQLADRLGGSLGIEELALKGMLKAGQLGGRGVRRGYDVIDDYILRKWTPTIDSPGDFYEMTRGGELIYIPTEVDLPGIPLGILETPMGTGQTMRVDFSPRLQAAPGFGSKSSFYDVDVITPAMEKRSVRALEARLKRATKTELRKTQKEEKEQRIEDLRKARQEFLDQFRAGTIELEKRRRARDPFTPSSDWDQYAFVDPSLSQQFPDLAQDVELADIDFRGLTYQNPEFKAKTDAALLSAGLSEAGRRALIQAELGAKMRLPQSLIINELETPELDIRRLINIMPEAIPIALGYDPLPMPSLNVMARALQSGETQLLQSLEALKPRFQVELEQIGIKNFEDLVDKLNEATITDKRYTGKYPDLDWMPPPIVLTPSQLLEEKLQQRLRIQNPIESAFDSPTVFDPATITADLQAFATTQFPPIQRQPPVIQIPGQETIPIQAQPTGVAVDERHAFQQAFDMRQALKVPFKAPSKIPSKLKLDLKRREKELIKKVQAEQKRLNRTRKKFLFDLFKNEISIPSVQIPDVRIPSVNIEKVNIPSVNIEKVNIPSVNIEKVNVPSVKIEKVIDTQVHVPKVNIPAVRIYE